MEGTGLLPYVYLLRCRDGSLYAGAAIDLEKRLREHRAGKASRYTRSRLPLELAWSREVSSWSAALIEEARIKSLSRPAKELLMAAPVPDREPRSERSERSAGSEGPDEPAGGA